MRRLLGYMDISPIPPSTQSPLIVRTRRYLLWYVGVIGAIILFGVGFFSGYTTRLTKESVADASTTKTVVIGKSKTKKLEKLDFGLFWDVWDRIQARYLRRPVDENDLYYGALQGLVASTRDPYSAFFPPKIAEEFAQDLAGAFEGIGAEIGIKDSQVRIVAPLDGSPAARAGLQSGDAIIAIDDAETFNMPLDEAVKRIRGPQGTTVRLTIFREGEKETREVNIVRERIELKSVVGKDLGEGRYLIRISQFNEQTLPNFEIALRDLQQKNAKGIIVDLRNNPGGFLDTAIKVTSEWLPVGSPVVIERGTNGEGHTLTAVAPNRLVGVPTVVLVNRGSASGSEIMAGALQDYKAATLVGEKTFGKGSVQDYEVLPDGSGLKLTVAEWLTPNGNFIHEHGVTPDVVVDIPKDTAPDEDVFLDRGLEVLKSLMNKK